MIDEELYQMASDELNSDQRRPDIWARACALASDDHDEARYLYTNLRVEQLLNERQSGGHDDESAIALTDEADGSDSAAPMDGRASVDDGFDDDDDIDFRAYGLSPPETEADNVSDPAFREDVSASEVETHEVSSEDLTPDDFAAATIDLPAMDDAEGMSDSRSEARAADALPEPAADTAKTSPDTEASGGSYWDDDDYTFELEPLETPANEADGDSDEFPDGMELSATGGSGPAQADQSSSTRTGIDAGGSARLTEDDMAGYRSDSLSADDADMALADADTDGSADGAAYGSAVDDGDGAYSLASDDDHHHGTDGPAADDGFDEFTDALHRETSDDCAAGYDTDEDTQTASAAHYTDNSDFADDYDDDPSWGIDGDTDTPAGTDTDTGELTPEEIARREAQADEFGKSSEIVAAPRSASVRQNVTADRGSAPDPGPGAEPGEPAPYDREVDDARYAPVHPEPHPLTDDKRLDSDSPGRSWLIYRRGPDELRAVKQGVSWPALFFTLPWLLSKLLFGTALVYSLLWLILMAGLLVTGLTWLDNGPATVPATRFAFGGFALLAVIGLLYVPFRQANGWLARKLERRGFSVLRQMNARSAKAAIERVRNFMHG